MAIQDIEPDQLARPYSIEVVDTPETIQIEWDSRTNFNQLILRTAVCLGGVALDRSISAGLAEPNIIERGLYIERPDPRHRTAEQLYGGVVFPAGEFMVVARSPNDLARHVRSGTREANMTVVDRDEVDEKVGRSAARSLKSNITRLARYTASMSEKRLKLLSLIHDIDPPLGVVHFKARNLDRLRKKVDLAIHETAEVATISLDLDTSAIKSLHKVNRYNLYGSNNQQRRMSYWRKYILMTGKHTKTKMEAASGSINACERELKVYAPFLENA